MAQNHQLAGFRAARRAAGPLLTALLIAAFYWKLSLTRQYTWLDSFDYSSQVLPWLQFAAGELHAGHLPLWDPHEWGGQPFLGQMQTGLACPLMWPLFALPLYRGWITVAGLHGYFVLIHCLAGVFAYLLCRDLKRSRSASVFGGCAFAITAFIGNIDWPQMLDGAVWAPVILLFALRVFRGQDTYRSAAFAGAAFGMAALSGHHQAPLLFGIAISLLWLWHAAQLVRAGFGKRAALEIMSFAVLAGTISAMQVIPAAEYAKLAVRWVGAAQPMDWKNPVPYYVHSGFSFEPAAIVGFFIPFLNSNGAPFVGITVLTLAAIGVFRGARDPMLQYCAALGAIGLLLALGQVSILHGLFYAVVPVIEKARSPHFALLICGVSLSVLSAYGIDNYASNAKLKWLIYSALTLFALSLTVLLIGKPVPSTMIQAGCAMVALYLTLGASTDRRFLVCAAVVLLLIENGWQSGFGYQPLNKTDSSLRRMSQPVAATGFIRSLEVPVRVEIPSDDINFNWGDWHGIDVMGSYLASVTSNVYDLSGYHWGRMLLGSNYSIGRKPVHERQVPVFSGTDGMNVYFTPEAFPRSWVVHRVAALKSEQEKKARLEAGAEALRAEAFVAGAAPAVDSCSAPDQVDLLERQSGRVTLQANLACRGMVVLGETYFPGWTARVDGQRVKIFEVYGALRGVVAPAGRHRIVFTYFPRSVIIGIALSTTGFLLLGVIIFWRPKLRVAVPA